MYSKIGKFVCIAFFLVAGSSAAPTKKNTIVVNACRKSDPQFAKCIKTELQSAVPQLKNGYSKLRIPPIDPFELPALEIAKGQGAVSIDLSLQKLRIFGLSSVQIETIELDPEKLTGYAKFTFAKPINLVGTYTAKGKVQVLPINGKGPCNVTLIQPVLELINLQGESYEKDGVKYIRIKNAELKATSMSKVILKLDNLFQGNKELSDNLNTFINEEWQLLFQELRPAFEEAIVAIIKDIAGKVFQRVPQDDIFPA
jgi:hypothetical protein